MTVQKLTPAEFQQLLSLNARFVSCGLSESENAWRKELGMRDALTRPGHDVEMGK